MSIRVRQIIIYAVIVIVGLFLRTFRLADVPGRLTIDEMSIGYNAFSLIQTGRDEWEKSWPLIFRAFGDYKLPIYIYGSIPFIYLFGMNVVSIRIFSVISGIILIVGLGLLTQMLLKKRWTGYLMSLLLAINPWPVFISRMGLEANVGLAIFCSSLISLTILFRKKSGLAAVLTGILFGLSWYAYIAYRLITGFAIVGLVLMAFIRPKWRQRVFQLVLAFVICLLPLSAHIFDFSGRARFTQISLFSDIGFTSEINEDRSICFLQDKSMLPNICPIFFNKPFSWMTSFIENYVQVFSPEFLFITGGSSEHLSVPGFGEYFVIFLPFYLIGILEWVKKREGIFKFLGFLGLISPVASALAGPAHVVRSSPVIPFIMFAILLGLVKAWKLIRKTKYAKMATVGGGLIVIIFACRYLLNFFYVYPAQFDAEPYPLPPELGYYLKENSNNYKKIYFSPIGPGLHMFIAYYLNYQPDLYQKDIVWPDPDEIGFTHPHYLGKFEFDTKKMEEVFESSESGVLFVGLESDLHEPTVTFNNFTGVHPQAMIYDVDVVRELEKLNPEVKPTKEQEI